MSRFIPQEVVEQILSKLPIKPLLRFMTVSKQWYKLITTLKLDKRCSQLLFGFSPEQNGYVFCIGKNGTFEQYARYECPVEEGCTDQLSLDSYGNGLICFGDEKRAVLWNPSIRRSFRLLESDIKPQAGYKRVFGIVLDRITNDYKILRTVDGVDGDMTKTFVEIFRFSTGSWEIVDCKLPFRNIYGYQVDLNGIYYWIGTGLSYFPVIVSFDGHEESFGSIDLDHPSIVWDYNETYLFLFKGSLVVVHAMGSSDYINFTHQIWKIEDIERKSWNLWCEISAARGLSPVGFRENGEFIWVQEEAEEFRYVSITLGQEFTRRSISRNHENASDFWSIYENHENTPDFCHDGSDAIHIHGFSNYVESLALLDVTSKQSEHLSL